MARLPVRIEVLRYRPVGAAAVSVRRRGGLGQHGVVAV